MSSNLNSMHWFRKVAGKPVFIFFVVRKIPYFPTLLVNWSYQVFLINRNATVKLSSINIIHVKQQHNISFSIFKFTLKYMLGNVYVNKIHVGQCLYIISSFCGGFPHPFNFFVLSKGIITSSCFEQLRRKDFSMEQLPIGS